MTTLHCRHCGGAIGSESRRVQCSHCGALFPFACRICNRNLRTPFSIFADERYLTLEEIDVKTGARVEPHPLCQDHFLRKCPDCGVWYHAHENEGFFRCINCAEEQRQKRLERAARAAEAEAALAKTAVMQPQATPSFGEENIATALSPAQNAPLDGETQWERAPWMGAWDLNSLVLASAGGALLALIGWFFINNFKF